MNPYRVAVVSVSDRVSAGESVDESGPAVADRLRAAGFSVGDIEVVPDEQDQIAALIGRLSETVAAVITTGGTGFGPRDVTPEATRLIIDREAPGLGEAMRAAGRQTTPLADLSRGIAGIAGSAVVLNLPGSPKGALESLEAVVSVLPHAFELLAGRTHQH